MKKADYKKLLEQQVFLQDRFRIWCDLVLHKYRHQSIVYLQDLYKEYTGLQLGFISTKSIDVFFHCGLLQDDTHVYMQLKNSQVVFYPNGSVLNLLDDSRWPWNISSVDYSTYGKDIWNCITNHLNIFDFVHLSMANKRFCKWFIKDDRRFEEFIYRHFWIYRNQSRAKILKRIAPKQKYNIADSVPLEFLFCCLFPYKYVQKTRQIVYSSSNKYRVRIEELDVIIELQKDIFDHEKSRNTSLVISSQMRHTITIDEKMLTCVF